MSESDWVQLTRRNDWGAEYIALRPLTDTGFASARRALQVVAGEMVEAQAKDGTVLTLPIVMRTFRGTVSDHGHESVVVSTLPGLEIDLLGEKHWMPLDAFKVRGDWAEQRQP